ncbi:hypothetical protein HK44_000190 [Pseudomonas fluorescens HK44]|uniref:Uncharacterized protein n=1 Tax=Pseudomonas fluorescens HK44 TaxID=1042209 RepID=A0A010SVB3_PSEFL|nr:hypothetical protein HK44_000190 [Pseudomonas fluorescens HK44]
MGAALLQTLKIIPVGASLLAMAVDQATSILPVMAYSRAGSLPQDLRPAA